MNKTIMIPGDMDEVLAVPERSIELWKEAVDLQPSNQAARRGVGWALLNEGSVERAIQEWQKGSVQVDWLIARGFLTGEQGRWDIAQKWFELALKLDPYSSKARYWLGKSYWHQKDGMQALTTFRTALNYDQSQIPLGSTYYYIGHVLLNNYSPPDYFSAWQAFESAAASGDFAQKSDELYLYYWRAEIKLHQGDLISGIKEAKHAIQIDPTFASGYSILGRLYWASNDFTAAEENLLVAYKLSPMDTGTVMALAKLYEVKDQFTRAEYFYKLVVDLDPNNSTAEAGLTRLHNPNHP